MTPQSISAGLPAVSSIGSGASVREDLRCADEEVSRYFDLLNDIEDRLHGAVPRESATKQIQPEMGICIQAERLRHILGEANSRLVKILERL